MNNRVYLIEVLGAESRVTGQFTRGNTLEPYPVECLAGHLEANGFETRVLQIGSMTDSQILEDIISFNPTVVGMTLFTYSVSHGQALAQLIKTARPTTKVVVGGYHPSLVPSVVECTNFDYAVQGEGEITFLELCQVIAGLLPKEDTAIKGISFVHNGEVFQTAPRPRVKYLDDLADAKRDGEYLRDAGQFGPAYPAPTQQIAVAEIHATRGCPNHCTFCVSHVQWVKAHGVTSSCDAVSYRSPKRVVAEMRRLHDTFGVNLCYFTDLTFNQNPEYVRALCAAMIAEGLHDASTEDSPDHTKNSVHWYALVKVGLTPELAQTMADAGCSKIGMGVESFSTARNKAWIKPHVGLDITYQSLKAAHDAGIITRCLLVVGSPEETDETISETIEHLKNFPIDQFRASYITPFPGTDVASTVTTATDDWDLFDTDHPVIEGNLSLEELVAARTRMGRELYGSPEYKERIEHTLKRFPHFRESYRWWFNFLSDSGLADLRDTL